MDEFEAKDGQPDSQPRPPSRKEQGLTPHANLGRAGTQARDSSQEPAALAQVIAFPARKKPAPGPRRPSPVHLLGGQRCLVCERLGCVPVLITAKAFGGKLTGDNLLPLCFACASRPVVEHYARYRRVKLWLEEHERQDALEILENLRLRLKIPLAWK